MFDTMVFTKLVGAFCGALLVFLLGQWAASELYTVGRSGDEQAYVIAMPEDDDDDDDVEDDEMTFEQRLASADPDAGSGLWSQCRACHALEEGQHGVGPSMYQVVGRQIASIDGFGYSGALPDGEWTPEELSAFIENPSDYAPGTSMSYGGLGDMGDRADLIAYMHVESGGDMDEFEVAEAERSEDDEDDATEDDATEDEEARDEDDDADDASDFAALVSEQDPADGQGLWNQCRACHALEDGVNRVGPHLYDLIDREVGSVDGFNYSGALSEVADVWDYDALSAFIENPREYAPGTSMAYAGMGSEEDRAKLIAYIEAEGQ